MRRRGSTTSWAIRPTINHPDETEFAAEVAREVSGEDAVDARANREMGSEDFAYMLEARPGAYLFLGTGPGAGLHHPAFDFNDEAAPVGATLLCAAGRAGAAAGISESGAREGGASPPLGLKANSPPGIFLPR